MLPATWKTLFLPENFPSEHIIRNYVFGHNDTHVALALDYGSLFNHHERANVQAVDFPLLNDNVYFEVRRGFVYTNRNVLNVCVRMHAYTKDTRTHTHFQGHKRHRAWTGNFGSVRRCGMV